MLAQNTDNNMIYTSGSQSRRYRPQGGVGAI